MGISGGSGKKGGKKLRDLEGGGLKGDAGGLGKRLEGRLVFVRPSHFV